MARDRGIAQSKMFAYGFLDLIERAIRKKGRVKILDAGCGHGVAMLDLVKLFGETVELVGFNYSREHGDPRLLKTQAAKKGLFSATEFRRLKNKPRFVYLDAGRRLPFGSGSFDFIYSNSAIYLFDDKARFLEECHRVLRKGGVARLEVPYQVRKGEQADEYTYAWEIWDEGRLLRPEEHFSRFEDIRVGIASDGNIFGVEITKRRPRLDLGLKLIAAIDSNFIWRRWMGVKSIYTTQKAFKPHWR